MSLGTEPASKSRNRLYATGTGGRKLAVIDAWIAANPAGDGNALLEYLEGNPLVDAVPGDDPRLAEVQVSMAGTAAKLRAMIA